MSDAALADIPRLLAALPPRIDDIVTLQAARQPATQALGERASVWTYAELAVSTAAVAQSLSAAEVREVDRVLVVGANCAALVALLFGIARAGAWPVLVNARLAAREIDAIRD